MDDVLVKQASVLNSSAALKQVQSVVLSQPRQQAWKSFVQSTMDYGRQQGQTMTVGVMQAEELAYAKSRGAKIDSPIIFVADNQMKSPKATRHIERGDALSIEDWIALPELLAKPEMVAWDTEKNTVVYLLPGLQGDSSRFAVRFGTLKANGLSVPDSATTFKTPKEQFEAYIQDGRYERIR